jgi:hypothetical protein
MEAVNLPLKEKIRQNLLSGQSRIFIKRSHYIYSVIYPANQSSLPRWLAFKWLLCGDHGDTAFQFGASISVELNDAQIIDFEVSVCELICRKDTGKLIDQTILPQLTNGLQVVATMPLHIETDEHGLLQCRFSRTAPVGNRNTPPKVEVYLTAKPG